MAQVLAGGNDAFDALAYGRPHPGTMQFLETQLSHMSQSLTQAGQQFMAGAAEVYDRLNGATAMRILRAAGRAAKSIWQSEDIKALFDIGQFQHAPLVMQRWIMTEPSVRGLYHAQRCDGYSDTYVDLHPHDIGEAHYDYRRVMDGMVVMGTGEDEGWSSTTYFEDTVADEIPLSFEDQNDILQTWEAIRWPPSWVTQPRLT
jgi:hypothetical protein